jgi:lysosomal Pro-X carboxypeptidase
LLSHGERVVEGMAAAAGVFYNASGTVSCYSIANTAGLWDYQSCVGDGFMPMSRNGRTDMFYEAPFSMFEEAARCNQTWGVVPDLRRGIIEFGGRDILDHISNIVFSNGVLDPWSSGGVLDIPHHLEKEQDLSTVLIEDGAHHLDLFWSNPADPESVKDARRHEKHKIRHWIDQFYDENEYFTLT